MISFNSYASSSSGNVYTVSDSKTTIMLDCGLRWKKIKQLLGFTTSDIAAILVSHGHLDHTKGIVDAAKSGIDIFASKATFDKLNLSGHRMIEISDMQQFTVGTWSVMPFKTIHDAIGSLAFYMVTITGDAFLYLTDSAYSPVRFKNLNVIAVECNFVAEKLSEHIRNGYLNPMVGRRIRRNHMSLETLIKMLKANDLSKCRAIYLLHLSNGNSDEMMMVKEVQQITGIPTYALEA